MQKVLTVRTYSPETKSEIDNKDNNYYRYKNIVDVLLDGWVLIGPPVHYCGWLWYFEKYE